MAPSSERRTPPTSTAAYARLPLDRAFVLRGFGSVVTGTLVSGSIQPEDELEIHPLGIGGKADPARLVFDAKPGPAVNVCLVDMGGRMRMIAAELDVVKAEHAMPKLPVARALWVPKPDFKRGLAAWIEAGGAHHAVFCQAVGSGEWEDLAAMAGIEFVKIDAATDLGRLRDQLRWNDLAFAHGR